MVSAIKNASKSYIAFRLKNFLHLLIIRFVISQKSDVLGKTETRFRFSTGNYSGNDICHSMNTKVIFCWPVLFILGDLIKIEFNYRHVYLNRTLVIFYHN